MLNRAVTRIFARVITRLLAGVITRIFSRVFTRVFARVRPYASRQQSCCHLVTVDESPRPQGQLWQRGKEFLPMVRLFCTYSHPLVKVLPALHPSTTVRTRVESALAVDGHHSPGGRSLLLPKPKALTLQVSHFSEVVDHPP